MSDLEWRVTRCPDCSAKFKAPADLEDGADIACPACGAEVFARSEPERGGARPASLPARKTDPLEALHASPDPVRDLNPGGSALPPAPEKSVSLDLTGLAVRDTNRKPYVGAKDEASAPRLEHLEKVARTDDEEFAAIDDEPRRRVTSKRVEEEIVGWDDGGEAKRDASRSTVASTFKLALGALPVLIGVGIFAMSAQPKNNSRSLVDQEAIAAAAGALAGTFEKPEPDPTSPVELRNEIGADAFLELIRDTAARFLQSATLESRLALVRHPERVRPLMESYYRKHPLEPMPFDKVAPNERYHIERNFIVTGLALPGYDALPIVLSRKGDKLLVDWESFVGYGEMELSEFVRKRPTQPVLMRLRAKPDDYFNYRFDEGGYHCIALSDLKFTERLYGYFEKGSPTAEKFFNRMAKESGIDFVILKVRYPPNAVAANQVIIDEFIDVGWLMRD